MKPHILVKYTAIVLWHILGKVVGLFYIYITFPFRKYSRNTHYNYILNNHIYYKRLLERPITETNTQYIIAPFHETEGGYINKRNVSYIEYILNFILLYSWLDDDANDDTFDYGRVEALREESKIWRYLLKGVKRKQYGNSFDLGDNRESNFHFWACTTWNFRNTFQNAKYATYEISEEEWKTGNYPLYKIGSYEFGWVPFDGSDIDKQGRLAFLSR